MASTPLILGTKSHVVAIDRNTGGELWRTKLKGVFSGDRFVSILVHEGRVYAHTAGEISCLDQATGAILWRNGLSGLGYEIASLAIEGIPGATTAAAAAHRAAAGQTSTIGATSASS